MKQKENYSIIYSTHLKEFDSKLHQGNHDLLYYEKKSFIIKRRMLGFNKGYIFIGNNEYIAIKKYVPFILLFLLLFLVFISTVIALTIKSESPPQDNHNSEIPGIKENIPTEKEPEESKEKPKENNKASNNTAINHNSTSPETQNIPEESINPSEKIEKYSISYELNGGTLEITNPKSYIKGEDLELFSPLKDGYIFEGWYDNSKFTGKEINRIDSSMTEDKILYAKWSPNKYNIAYTTNGGSGEMNIIQVKYDEKYNLSKNIFTKDGYSFIGWSTTKNGAIIYEDEEEVVNLSSENEATITLYAQWQINQYQIRFLNYDDKVLEDYILDYGSQITAPLIPYRMGYEFISWSKEFSIVKDNLDIKAEYKLINYSINYDLVGGSMPNQVIEYNIETDTFSISNPTKIGYTFTGWSVSDEAMPKKNIKVEKGTTGNLYLIANYEPINYKIEYNANTGIGGTNCSLYIYDIKIKLNKNIFTKEGYSFIGWSTTKNGAIIYEDEEEVVNLSSENGATITLYAQWQITKHLVSFLDWDNRILSETSINYGTTITPPSNPEREGYIFKGWNLSEYFITESTTFKAVYSAVPYKIYLNFNQNLETDNKEITYNIETSDILLPLPSRVGYTFTGWTGTNGPTPQTNITIPKGSIGNQSYIANWKANTYNVYFDTSGGSTDITNKEVVYDSLYGELPVPIKPGYTFEGWFYEDEQIYSDTILEKDYDHELIAKWNVIEYSIIYNLNGGSISGQSITYTIETDNFILPNATRVGYTFTGWTGTNGSTPQTNITIPKGSIGDRTYNANWQVITYSISYSLNSGTVSGNPTSYNIETNNFMLNNPTRIGYSFIGWSGTGLSGSNNMSVSIPRGSIGNRSYTANFYDDIAPTIFSITWCQMIDWSYSHQRAINVTVNAADYGVGIGHYGWQLIPAAGGVGGIIDGVIDSSYTISSIISNNGTTNRDMYFWVFDRNGNGSSQHVYLNWSTAPWCN